MSLIGKDGLKELAQLNLNKAEYAKQQIEKIEGVEVKRERPKITEGEEVKYLIDETDKTSREIPKGISLSRRRTTLLQRLLEPQLHTYHYL